MFFVYILQSELHRRFYTGSTQDILNRVKEHNAGERKSTRSGIPWKLIHVEEYLTRAEAVSKEKRIKARGVARYLGDVQKSG